jgi:ATP-dependent RNA helicase SUPV3L1/SUV3
MRYLRDDEQSTFELDDTGSLTLRAEQLGKIEGFVFTPDPRADIIHQRTIRSAAAKMLEQEFASRARALINALDDEFSLTHHGTVWWGGAVVAKLSPGSHALSPAVELKADDQLRNTLRQAARTRIETWLERWITSRLEPLVALKRAAEARTSSWQEGGLPGPARALAFRLAENLGHLSYDDTPLTAESRKSAGSLKRFGVKAGARAFYLPRLIKPASAGLTAMLWAIQHRMEQLPAPPNPGVTSFTPSEGDGPRGFLEAACFRILAGRAVRLDIIDRVDEVLSGAAKAKADATQSVTVIASLLGASTETAVAVAGSLGWRQKRQEVGDAAQSMWRRDVRKPKPPRPKDHRPDSPFAELSALIPSGNR